ISVVDDAVLESKRAHTRSLARIRGRISSAHGRECGGSFASAFPRLLAFVVVVDASLALLLLGEPDAEIVVEIAAKRRGPGKCPTHSSFVLLQLRQRRARDRPKHHVMIREMKGKSVVAVGDR